MHHECACRRYLPALTNLPPFRLKTDHNVDVLDRAGVLGAVLALIAREATSVRKKRPLSKASTDCLQVQRHHVFLRLAVRTCIHVQQTLEGCSSLFIFPAHTHGKSASPPPCRQTHSQKTSRPRMGGGNTASQPWDKTTND